MGDEQGQGGIAAPNEVIIFLDENHCRNRYVIDAIEAYGIRCEKHLDHFAAGTADVDWLPEVGRRGWCLLTTDARIRTNQLERESVRLHCVRMFYFPKNNLSGKEMGIAISKALSSMLSLALSQPAPFMASIGKNGDVNLRNTFEVQ